MSIDWPSISHKLPAGKSPAEKAERDKLFRQADPNGNGYLSLAEVDRALRDVLRVDAVFDCKPAIMRAFQAAKKCDTKDKSKPGGDYVTRSEFRVLLSYLRKYFELYVMFDRLDTSDDRRISLQEFSKGVDLLRRWGVTVTDPAAEFHRVDRNGGGFILFDEFCNWAIPKGLDLEDDDD
eukprot:GGOE01054409.1.p1 GENE.GGOE01054409.1~~GGOE01054409.1.p1  ORF type:complete len:179 (-),score=59.53 GGOE01054409.1:311-847(-)